MMPVVLVHGWGFDASFWDGLRGVLGDAPVSTLDPGGFDAPAAVSGPVLAVGHSLGLLWLLTHAELPVGSQILGINGFSRFSAAPDFPAGVARRVLDRMSAGMARDAQGVLTAFRALCGAEGAPPAGLVPEKLLGGLDLLREGDARTSQAISSAGFRVLAGDADPVVTSDMTRGGFAPDRIEWVAGGGHLLPLTDPLGCASFLRRSGLWSGA